MKALGALLAVTLALTGCGSDDDGGSDVLDAAQEHLLDAESGEFSLQLEGEREGKDVGFSVEGAFEYPGDDTYPVVDVTYERRQGTDTSTNAFRSDGTSAWIVNGAAVTPVGVGQLRGLRAREGIAAAVPDLEFASWFDEVEREGNRFVGTVDVAELVGDLRRVAAEMDGNQAPDTLDGDGADELRDALVASTLEVEVGDDDEFRSLTATLDFGDDIPRALDDVLVSYASPRLELRVTLAPLDGPLDVETPGGD